MTYLKISNIIQENPQVKTFYFSAQGGSASGGDFSLKSKPGQFVMLWVPGIDQKPFSVAYDDGKQFGLTIFNRGPLTNKLFEMNIGGRVGIMGPYGTSFSIKPNTHYIMVAGGYGAAPLGFLAERLQQCNDVTIDFLIGARNKDLILFKERLTKIPNLKLHIATDDGSVGHHGYVTDLLKQIVSVKSASFCVCCGPELMEKKVLDICNEYNVDCEVSIERYMKCGYGVCGQCVVDDLGICMCTHGPVVNRDLANKLIEFGNCHREKSGARVSF